jgi:2-methylcitrate dehydratase
MKTNAPNLFRDEAINFYSVNPDKMQKEKTKFQDSKASPTKLHLSKCFGSKLWVHAEKAIVANVSAVREWDSNGTVFGYDPNLEGHQAGEFGHNDYYPVVIAACQNNPEFSGMDALKGMILLDEIRGRLAEVFSLKTFHIDHVVYGAVASAVTYGAMLGANVD